MKTAILVMFLVCSVFIMMSSYVNSAAAVTRWYTSLPMGNLCTRNIVPAATARVGRERPIGRNRCPMAHTLHNR